MMAGQGNRKQGAHQPADRRRGRPRKDLEAMRLAHFVKLQAAEYRADGREAPVKQALYDAYYAEFGIDADHIPGHLDRYLATAKKRRQKGQKLIDRDKEQLTAGSHRLLME